MKLQLTNYFLFGAVASIFISFISGSVTAQSLEGFASLPADTFAPGPTTGQFLDGGANGRTAPFINKQPVQGFSGMLNNGDGTFWMLSDNGYGTKERSQDYVLKIYKVRPHFRTSTGGDASVEVIEILNLSDPNHLLPFDIIADRSHYPDNDGSDSGIPVDQMIKDQRLITGADIDVESFRIDADGNFWFGDEFGPFLLQFNPQGELIRAPIELAGVASPQDPLGRETTHSKSAGYEGMSANLAGTLLYPMLEKPTNKDKAAGLRRLQINPFDPISAKYTGEQFFYELDPEGTAVGDFSPISDRVHMVIEREGGSGPDAKFKKVFLVDFDVRDADNRLVKREMVDLLNVSDPNDLDQNGSTIFTFPFTTIEDVVVIDDHTIAVANDNNYPFSAGRAAKPIIDNNEIIMIHFDTALTEMRVTDELKTILCYGDSITAAENGWVKRIDGSMAVKTINAGVGGRKAANALEDLIPYLEKYKDTKIDQVLLFLGVNDLPARDPRPGSEKIAICVEGMSNAIDRLLERFAPQDITLVAPCGVNADSMNAINLEKGYQIVQPLLETLESAYRQLASEKGVSFVSLLNVVRKQHYLDGLHPDDAGHAEIADFLEDFLK